MKSNKMAKLASVFLSASIAVMATACTVEFSDTDKTIESVEGTLTEIQAGANAQDQGTDNSVNPSDTIANTDINGSEVESIESLTDITDNEDIGQNTGTGNSGKSGSSSGVVYVTVTPNKPDTQNNNGQVISDSNSTDASTSSGNNVDEPKSSESTSAATATPTPTQKVTATPTATPTAKPTTKPTTSEVQRTVIREDVCLLFENPNFHNFTLDCKHGKFEVNPGDGNILITFNGKTFELPITWSDSLGVWPYGVTYVQRDGNEYIYIGSTMQTSRGFYHNLNVYKITGNDVTYVASTDGLSVLSQQMGDPAGFTASLEESEENGFDLLGTYEVGPDGMPVLTDNNLWFSNICNAVSFREKVSGYTIVNDQLTSDIASVSPDEYVILFATDGLSYLDIVTKAGVRIRLDWTAVFQACDMNDQFYIAHAIDANIDDRIHCYEF